MEIGRWKKKQNIVHDVCNYYGYLPAAFIYHDLTLSFRDSMRTDLSAQLEHVYTKNPEGKYVKVFKMSAGCAVLWTPFFLGTQHFIRGYGKVAELSGYSRYDHLMLNIAALFYLFVGLLFLRSVLLHFYRDVVAAVCLVLVAIGTNLYFYTAYEPGMSHVYSFSLFSALLFFTIRWHANRSFFNSSALGFVLGMIMLVRPVNGLAVLIPLLWNVNGFHDLKEKIRWAFRNLKPLTGLIVFFLIPLLLQVAYWKSVTGNYISYSYGEEKFFFAHPRFTHCLVGFRKGWFIYTPLMLLGIPGFIIAWRKKLVFATSALVFFPLMFWLVFSWWCWWYGGSFGMRSLIDFYPLWILAVGATVNWVFRRGWIPAILLVLTVSAGIRLNLFQSWQYSVGILHYDGMTRKGYFELWGAKKYPQNYRLLIAQPDYDAALRGEIRDIDPE